MYADLLIFICVQKHLLPFRKELYKCGRNSLRRISHAASRLQGTAKTRYERHYARRWTPWAPMLMSCSIFPKAGIRYETARSGCVRLLCVFVIVYQLSTERFACCTDKRDSRYTPYPQTDRRKRGVRATYLELGPALVKSLRRYTPLVFLRDHVPDQRLQVLCNPLTPLGGLAHMCVLSWLSGLAPLHKDPGTEWCRR